MSEGKTERQRYIQRLASLKTERSSWDAAWRELSDYIQPRRSRFFATEANRGERKTQFIVNSTPTRAASVLASGMMNGITNPASPWLRLGTADPGLSEFGPVRSWLHVVEQRILDVYARSNIYDALTLVYLDLGTPGTAALHVEEDHEDGLRAYVYPIGSYCLANNARQQVDTVYRELRMTVGQVVERFGLERCSQRVRDAYRECRYEEWVDVLHALEPRREYDGDRAGPLNMPFKSCWLELHADEGQPPLRESGFEEFPDMCPRWATNGEDVYGSGNPGLEALGDAKGLQILEKRKAQGVDKMVNPPMQGPGSMRGQRASILPGAMNWVDAVGPAQQFQPAHTVHPTAIGVTSAEIREHERRINASYFADLWLMLSQSDGKMTATEVAERREEKLLQLGPVIQRLQHELLDPLVDRTFAIGVRNGWFPPPPEELEGVDLRVEYTGIMAQAQRLVGASGVERLVSFVGAAAPAVPEVLDKVDFDQVVDEYGRMLGVPPDLIRTDEAVAELRARRADQEQAAQAVEVAAQGVQGAKVLSETKMEGDTALNRLLGNVVPGAAA